MMRAPSRHALHFGTLCALVRLTLFKTKVSYVSKLILAAKEVYQMHEEQAKDGKTRMMGFLGHSSFWLKYLQLVSFLT